MQKGQNLGLLFVVVPKFYHSVEMPKVFTAKSNIRTRVGGSGSKARDAAPPTLHLLARHCLRVISVLPASTLHPTWARKIVQLPAQVTIKFRRHKLVPLLA